MTVAKKDESKEKQNQSSNKKWAKWKWGCNIGASALTGETLMAITGGEDSAMHLLLILTIFLSSSWDDLLMALMVLTLSY